MKQIRDWIRKFSIRKKLMFYSYVTITPILVLISAMLFYHNYKSAIKTEDDICLQSVQSLSDSIESMQKNIMELGTYITINTDINQILTSNEPEELNKDSKLWLHHAPMQIIQDMLAINGQMKTVAIYPENGVAPYLRCMDFTAYLNDLTVVRNTAIYKEAVKSKGKVLWQRVGKRESDTYAFNRNEKIVMYREIYDLSKKKQLGYLAIGSSTDRFDEVSRNSLRNDKEAVIVVSTNGAELIRIGQISDTVIAKIMKQETTSKESKILTVNSQYIDYMVYRCRNEATGTVIYKLVPKTGFLDKMESVLMTPLLLLLGFLIGLYPILIIVSNIISKPLKALCLAMHEFKKGDFSQKVEVITFDEVGEASACFNEMVDDMKMLIDKNYVMALKERESELDALQAQINPHFLYNALDSLYWKAVEAGNEEISEDILALSELFRLVLNRGEGIVTVRNEQELLERYLHIQKMRFGRRLSYQIAIQESILEEEIPKLILQPFVENAIVHGFEKGDESYSLSITGRKQNGYMHFEICDTGIGMSTEQIAAIWKAEDMKRYQGQRIGRYAIKNVKERLELKYREDFQLAISSEQGKGTTVSLQIPCKCKEQFMYGDQITNS